MNFLKNAITSRGGAAVALIAALAATSAGAQDPSPQEGPPERRAPWYAPQRLVAPWREAARSLRKPEIVEMLSAVANLSQMGPGEGWFHPGQSRYGWGWLAARTDADGDGAVTQAEFTGAGEAFAALDRNRNGKLQADDFDWSPRSDFQRQAGQARQLFRRIDASSNGRITRREWEQFFNRASHQGEFITPEDLRAALNPPPPPNINVPEPTPSVFLYGLLTGELGSVLEGPRLDDPAPDFELPTHDGKERVHLADLMGKRPIVLIFGSFT